MSRYEVEVSEILTELCTQFGLFAEQKHIHVQMVFESELPKLSADPQLLKRALSNLLFNALDFTPEQGTIRISTQWEENGVCFQVEDSGRGFSPEELEHAKERFYQGNKSRGNGQHYGMDLYIAEQAISCTRVQFNYPDLPYSKEHRFDCGFRGSICLVNIYYGSLSEKAVGFLG